MKKEDRQKVFDKFGGKCAYCGCELTKSFHCDHVEPIQRNKEFDREKRVFKQLPNSQSMFPQRDNLDNIYPACASCNIQKHSYTLEEFRKNIQGFIEQLNLRFNQYKFAKKYGLVKETGNKVVFYFETLTKL